MTRGTCLYYIGAVALFHHIDLRVMWSAYRSRRHRLVRRLLSATFEHAEEDLYRRLGSDRTALLRRLNVFMPRTSAAVGLPVAGEVGRRDFGRHRRLGDERPPQSASRSTFNERGTRRLICEASYRVACVDATTFAPRTFPDEVVSLLSAAHQGSWTKDPGWTEDQGRTDQGP